MKILVTYGSRYGGTVGLARIVGRVLQEKGLDVEVRPPGEVRTLAPYDGVIVGGALYMGHWHHAARHFVRQHARQLRERAVWFFSSGPLDDSAKESEIPPTRQVRSLMRRIGARGHVTFGGRLAPDAKGFLARNMAKTRAGDWRDRAQVAHWADTVGVELQTIPAREHPADELEGRAAFHLRWTGACALAELLGIGAAAAAAIALQATMGTPGTGFERLVALLAFAWAGAVEGAALGGLQWRLLRQRLPLLSREGWIGITVAVAVIGWMAGMAGPTFASGAASGPEPSLLQVMAMAAGIGAVAGAIFGAAQWVALRVAAEHAGRWIAINVPAWALAMAAIFAGASIPAPGWPGWAILLSGASGGLLGGALLGVVTGFVAKRLEPRRLAEPQRPGQLAIPRPQPA